MMQLVPEFEYKVTAILYGDGPMVSVVVEATMDVRAIRQGKRAIMVDHQVGELDVSIVEVRRLSYDAVEKKK